MPELIQVLDNIWQRFDGIIVRSTLFCKANRQRHDSGNTYVMLDSTIKYLVKLAFEGRCLRLFASSLDCFFFFSVMDVYSSRMATG